MSKSLKQWVDEVVASDLDKYSYNNNGPYVDPDEILTTGLQDITHLLKAPAERTSKRLPTELIYKVHTYTRLNRAEKAYWAEKGKQLPEYSHDEAVQLHKAHAITMIDTLRYDAGYGSDGSSRSSTSVTHKPKRK